MTRATLLSVVCILGLAASAAVLILLIPRLFAPGEQVDPWVLGVFACLTVGFGIVSLRRRPSRPR